MTDPSPPPERLYETDAYCARLVAHVTAGSANRIRLDRTIFFPGGGGQPADRGSMTDRAGTRWSVNSLEKTAHGIEHALDPSVAPAVGSELSLELDWPLRFLHMRYHTAVHILSGVAFQRFGSAITGSQLGAGGARVDLAIPEARASTAEELVAEANRQVDAARPVEVRWVEAGELDRNPSLVRVRPDLLPGEGPLRLIDIVGFDVQADGGTHVRSTTEVGAIRLERFENKGARNKRLYVSVEPRPPPVVPPGS